MSNSTALSKSDFSKVEKRMQAIGMPMQKVLREVSFALQLINNSKDLQECSKESLLSAVVNIANIGLTLNPVAREASLISRWNSKKRTKEAGLEPSYIGLQKLAMDASGISSIVTNVVHENDEFSIDLADKVKPVTHKPCLIKKQRGDIIGAYSVATLQNGNQHPEWMDIDEIYKARERSESYQAYLSKKISKCTWVTDESEMCRKTVIKRLTKYLPRTGKTDALDQAIATDNEDYGASFNQVTYIETLLMTANVSDEKSRQIWDEINNGNLSFQQAKELIEYLKENQLDDPVQHHGGIARSKKEIGDAVANAVARENT